ncbi:uncharacterized protein BHQ10_010138 [Talaromyces amestolkiae]|uniref:Dynein light chain 1, cytoplasmic n=1 Tax=Talaromyces amestolkiae TaxID=1196081 RepID=A0A364LE84_TALAM|nr:uncharacterized protein BHQ10_010138 [Talaromyces amestolkiae]RAO74126.1 hypothetical protein BHQ10_010138 [Talaromyces amestolkiae]
MATEKPDKLAVHVRSVDMTEDMQQEAIEVATEAMEKFHMEKDIAQHIKKEFDSRKGATWHCIVGRNFGSFVTHDIQSRLDGYENVRAQCGNAYCRSWDAHCETRWPFFTICFIGIAKWKYLPNIMSTIAKAVYNLPLSWSNTVVGYLTSFPPDSDALHLVPFEFDEIRLSRWEASFRAIASYQQRKEQEKGQFPIRIFFGANDHWVDNELRDAFIYQYCDASGPLAFGKEALDLKARIDPSRDGDEGSVVIPHDFSIGHSEHVVPYVAEYVQEIIGNKI